MMIPQQKSCGYAVRTIAFFMLLFFVTRTGISQPASEISEHLEAIHSLLQEALSASEAAESATSIDDLKKNTDQVFTTVWGVASGLDDPDARGAVPSRDWKSRWQSDVDDFELETPEKFGVEPPGVSDPSDMGIVGRGRYARRLIWADSLNAGPHHKHTLASLNNVIGWMRMDYAPARGGMPRVDLTHHWDAPTEFWLSTADTGWIHEVYSQAMNILKTDYGDDLAEARRHAADMTMLIRKNIEGEDADNSGSIEPKAMEGGIKTALQHAKLANLM